MIIEKKIWPDKFELDRSLTVDFRLADFSLQPGDIVIFKEWDPKTKKYTGREYKKIVKQAVKSPRTARYWTPEQMQEHGMWLIEWKE